GGSGERDLDDVPSGLLFGMAVGIAGKIRVRAASRSRQCQTRAVIGVVGQATVFRGRAHGDDVGRPGGIGDGGACLVASGGVDKHAAPSGVVQGVDQLGDVGGGHVVRELEA